MSLNRPWRQLIRVLGQRRKKGRREERGGEGEGRTESGGCCVRPTSHVWQRGALSPARSPPRASPAAFRLLSSKKRTIYSFCFRNCFFPFSNFLVFSFSSCGTLNPHTHRTISPPCLQTPDLEQCLLKQTQQSPAHNPRSPLLHLSPVTGCFQPLVYKTCSLSPVPACVRDCKCTNGLDKERTFPCNPRETSSCRIPNTTTEQLVVLITQCGGAPLTLGRHQAVGGERRQSKVVVVASPGAPSPAHPGFLFGKHLLERDPKSFWLSWISGCCGTVTPSS